MALQNACLRCHLCCNIAGYHSRSASSSWQLAACLVVTFDRAMLIIQSCAGHGTYTSCQLLAGHASSCLCSLCQGWHACQQCWNQPVATTSTDLLLAERDCPFQKQSQACYTARCLTKYATACESETQPCHWSPLRPTSAQRTLEFMAPCREAL